MRVSVDSSTVIPAAEVARMAEVRTAANGVRYGTYGSLLFTGADILRIVEAVPAPIAGALDRKIYIFVPLVLEPVRDESPSIAHFSDEAAERAVCHRNVAGTGMTAGLDLVFISARAVQDKFALAFEFFINAGHGFVESAGVSPAFAELAWVQAQAAVKGETSVDAYECRGRALHQGRVDEKAKSEYLEASFSDAMAVYMLSMAVDVDYYELREREYPLLAPRALADRLRKVAEIFPPNDGYEFSIRYKRRG